MPITDRFVASLQTGRAVDLDAALDHQVDREIADLLLQGGQPKSGSAITFMLIHAIDHDLQGFDPAELHARPAYLYDMAREAGFTTFRAFRLRRIEAEIACGRIIAIMDHLARLLSPLADEGRIVVNLRCRCRIILRVESVYQSEFLRRLGFEPWTAPVMVTDGLMPRLRLATEDYLSIEFGPGPEAFLALPAASRAFVGLLSEMAEQHVHTRCSAQV